MGADMGAKAHRQESFLASSRLKTGFALKLGHDGVVDVERGLQRRTISYIWTYG